MHPIRVFSYLAVALAFVCLLALTGTPATRTIRGDDPQLVLWAWERPESLLFADSRQAGVAFLADSIYLENEPVLRPRFQPLRVSSSAPLTAVVRLEVSAKTPSDFAPTYIDKVARWIADTAALPQVRGVQVDFDAAQSQRIFYRTLLAQVHALLPPRTSLSITALGSWCMGDDWLTGLPIDEAVPMLFRMGVDRDNILRTLATGDDFREPLCRTSIGVSIDEPWPVIRSGRRVYVFSPHSWTPDTFAAVQRKLTP